MHPQIANKRFLLKSVTGKTFPAFPAHPQPAILRIWYGPTCAPPVDWWSIRQGDRQRYRDFPHWFMWDVAIFKSSEFAYIQFMIPKVRYQRHGRVRWIFIEKLVIEISQWRILIVLQGTWWRLLLRIGLVKSSYRILFCTIKWPNICVVNKETKDTWIYMKYRRRQNCLHDEIFSWFLSLSFVQNQFEPIVTYRIHIFCESSSFASYYAIHVAIGHINNDFVWLIDENCDD